MKDGRWLSAAKASPQCGTGPAVRHWAGSAAPGRQCGTGSGKATTYLYEKHHCQLGTPHR
jgi:hypothetical protein